MFDRPVWALDGRDWPNREASRFAAAGGISWHVQVMGSGPVLLLAHGTAAASHSWRDLMPMLAQHFTVVAPDLPGHGFTKAPPTRDLTLEGMARLLGTLTAELGLPPAVAVGHSAGAAILIKMCLDKSIAPNLLVSLNGALVPFGGRAGQVFSPLAKLLALNPFVPQLVAWRAGGQDAIERLINNTGSELDARGAELYSRLIRRSGHVSSVIKMMANWDLAGLERRLSAFTVPTVLAVGEADLAVPPSQARALALKLAEAELVSFPGLGHLAHEEAPGETADLIVDRARKAGIFEPAEAV